MAATSCGSFCENAPQVAALRFIVGQDAQLRAVLDTAGSTPALIPASHSPVVGRGDVAIRSAAPVGGLDPRQQPRPKNQCSAGSVELQLPEPTAEGCALSSRRSTPGTARHPLGLLSISALLYGVVRRSSRTRRRAR